eukprot:10832909-Alexandrium_andersonii.AAC.1
MSASLVGSEMCIRDRSSGAGAAKERFGDQQGRVVALCKGSCGGGGRVPVSYTHLTLPTICSV